MCARAWADDLGIDGGNVRTTIGPVENKILGLRHRRGGQGAGGFREDPERGRVCPEALPQEFVFLKENMN